MKKRRFFLRIFKKNRKITSRIKYIGWGNYYTNFGGSFWG